MFMKNHSFYEVDIRRIEFIIGFMQARSVRKNMFTNKLLKHVFPQNTYSVFIYILYTLYTHTHAILYIEVNVGGWLNNVYLNHDL